MVTMEHKQSKRTV